MLVLEGPAAAPVCWSCWLSEDDPGCCGGWAGEGQTAPGVGGSLGVGAILGVDVGAGVGVGEGASVGVTTATGGAGSGTAEPSTEIFRPPISGAAWGLCPVDRPAVRPK